MQDEQKQTSWSWEELVYLYADMYDRGKRISKMEHNSNIVEKEDNSGRGLILLDVEK